MRKLFFALFAVLLFTQVFFPVAGRFQGSISSDPYKETVLKERQTKDIQFKNPKQSPLTPEDIPGFKGLKYYPYNAKFRVTATLDKIQDYKIIRMKTTTERKREYRTWAIAHFKIDGKDCRLMIYQPVDLMKEKSFENYLFLPFTDETSGRTTYGGGRFLELSIPQGNTMIIDFNSAFNPYCAYNHKYSCPIPPEENDLTVKIEAGELPLKADAKH